MSRIVLDRLDVRFGEVHAVDEVSLDIAEGEFVVLLGPSGCGKTTTLRCIAGLETHSGGSIRFDDTVVDTLTPQERKVAMVFQFVSLYPHLRLAENIAFPLRAQGMRGAEVKHKVDRIAEIFDLKDMLNKRPAALPPGAWQKAALARAMVREPRVLLLDEPLSAIDERFREEMRWELRHIQNELGMTTIHVTHDQREAMSLADRVVLMKDGRIAQIGTPAELFDEPCDLFAAQFIGSPSMNLIPAEREGAALRIAGQTIELPDTLKTKLERSEAPAEITLGIRPNDVTLAQDDTPLSLAARIVDVTSLGREYRMDFQIADQVFKGVLGDDIAPPPDARIALNVDRLLVFGPDGRRIELA